MVSLPELPNQRTATLPCGWKKEIKKRKSGKTAGKLDIYIYSPDQRVFRSKKSLQFYLEQTSSPLKITDFDFGLQVDRNSSLTEKEIKAKDSGKEVDNVEDVISDNLLYSPVHLENTGVSSTVFEIKEELILEKPCQTNISTKSQDKVTSKRVACKRSPYFSCRKQQPHKPVPSYFRCLSKWDPPRSPYNLIQEDLYHDPWKMLVATICLQKTTGKAVKKVISQFFDRFPTPQVLLKSQPSEIMNILQPLGLQEKKSKILLRFSEEYLNKQWKYPIELHGIGKYGNDSYRIFCVNEWKQVQPKDHMLEKYHQWLINQSCES